MTTQPVTGSAAMLDSKRIFYNRFLLVVAGLGGLLYGVDVGIIAGALPYLEATSELNRGQLSIIVAAVLLGSVISTLFAGLLADWIGRKALMALSGVMFVISIPMIALAHGYGPLVFGRLLQGTSAGLIGVVVPLYLAECLTASNRGKGTGVFQWLLTAGIATAALIGLLFSFRLEHIAQSGDANAIFAFKNSAWRGIFWVSLPPGDSVRDWQLDVVGIASLAPQARKKRFCVRRFAAFQEHGAGRSRAERNAGSGVGRDDKASLRCEGEGFAPAAEVCNSIRAGLHHSRVQSNNRH